MILSTTFRSWLIGLSTTWLIACARPPASMPANEAAAFPSTPHCFSVTLDMDGDDVAWRACAERRDACEQVQKLAKASGGSVGVTSVSACTSD